MTTDLQAKMIVAIAEDEYTPVNGARPMHADDATTWAGSIIITPQDKGTFTSLKNAGMVYYTGKGKDAAVGLTASGFAEYNRIKDKL